MIDGNGPGAVALGEGNRALALTAVKAVLRVSVDDEDALIAAFVESALGLCEQFTGTVMLARTMRDRMFDERDARVAPPVAVTALWRPFRRMALRERQAC